MRAAGDGADGVRLRALIVILWRADLRIGEALNLAETNLDRSRGAVLVRRSRMEPGAASCLWGEDQANWATRHDGSARRERALVVVRLCLGTKVAAFDAEHGEGCE